MNVRRTLLAIAIVAAALLFPTERGWAQQTTGAIRGTLLDSTGSVVPNAAVTARNLTTGAQWENRSDELGHYSFPLLPPGSYSVTADATGFKKLGKEPILVRITEVTVVNFNLEVGAVSESINVTEQVPLVQADTSSTGRVIEHNSIVSIPLSTRNFTQLLGLTPGISTEPFNAEQVGFGTVNPNVNGMRKGSNNYLLDGQVNNNPMNNALEGIGTPTVDFLQEFKVITNLYSAEYGRNAGSIVNVVTRGGTNQVHGNLFEFFRNTELNARPYFAQKRGQNQQNQYGASIGGPVFIPKVYDGRNRSFFFMGYEGLSQRNTNSNAAIVIGRVPTAEERRGLFSSPITDPLTGQPFPGNLVPASRINPTSAQIMERYVPLGNVSDPRVNFIQQFGTPFDGNQLTYRVDHAFSEKDRLSFRHYTMWADRFAASGRLPGFGNVQKFNMRQLTLSETHVFSPRLVNEARFSYYNFPSSSTDDQRIDATTVGIRPLNPDRLGLPGIIVTGFIPYGYTGNDWKDQISAFTWNDTLTLVKGRHTAKWGGELRYGQEQSFGVPFQGRFTYNGQYSGNALVDFLLAAPDSVTVANGPGKIDMRDWNFDVFAQDDWKVTSRFTLNLGLRYEYNRPLTDTLLGRLLNFYPERYKGPGVDSGLVIGGETAGVPASTVLPDKNNFAPRLGFAYALGPQSRTVVRGGFGIFYDTRTGQITQQKLFEPPYSAVSVKRYTRTDAPGGYVFPPAIDLSRPTETVPGGSLSIRPIEFQTKTDYAEQWNFGLQHQLSNGVAFETTYVGTHGLKLFRARNINFPRLINGRLMRPYDGLSTVMYQEESAYSIYHSFQFTVQKRFSHGSTVLGAYTLGKAIDEASGGTRYYTNAAGDPQNLRGSRGLADFDRTHRLVVSYSLALPNPFGGDARGFAKAFSGWEASGITTIQSGSPFSVVNSQSNLDQEGDAGSPGSPGRADWLGTAPAFTPGSVSQRLDGFLNPTAFSPAPRSRYGNLGRNVFRGPGSNLFDFRVTKSTPLKEQVSLKFLTEFFNLFNHPSFGNPATNLSTGTFGTIRSTLSNARIIQFALKVEY